MEDLSQLVDDLRVDATPDEIWGAMQEMDREQSGSVNFQDVCKWWSAAPSPSPSGVLRSKLKLSAFTAKANGPILNVADTSNEGAGDAEAYLNELLSAAFQQKTTLKGNACGCISHKNKFRLWCQHVVVNPVADRVLVALIFSNVGLMALQTPGSQSHSLSYANFAITVIFTLEMAARIVINGFYLGENSYLSNPWDVFDFVIINVVWMLYFVSLLIAPVPDSVSYSLVMLRTFRGMRFFQHIRNVINAVILGRKMTLAITAVILYMIGMWYVVGHSLYKGVADTACVIDGTCPYYPTGLLPPLISRNRSTLAKVGWNATCGREVACPGTYYCDETCAELPLFLSNQRESHIDKYGFDTFGKTLLTVSAIVTCDGWEEIAAVYRSDHVIANDYAWVVFAGAVLFISLFAVNLFLAGLAYSFIKVRAASRSLDSANSVKRTMVERMLLEGHSSVSGRDRHLLQILNPIATRACRKLLSHRRFHDTIMVVVVANLAFMASDHHEKSKEAFYVFEISEAIFTTVYFVECCIKLQGMGFSGYFAVILNRFDFIIVASSVFSYLLLLWDTAAGSGKGTAVLRVLRMLKFVRAARVARIIFRSPPVREMIAKAFRGLDAVFSLVLFILFILALSAILGMNMFYHCHGEGARLPPTMPAYTNFWKSFMVSFQVMVGDGWTELMYNYIECTDARASVFFIFLQYSCSFVLCNLFVAIFMENFEIEDEAKRELQIEKYLEDLAGNEVDGKAWVKGLRGGITGMENLMAEDGKVNILRKRTANELIRGARLSAQATGAVGKRVGGLSPVVTQVNRLETAAKKVTPSVCSKFRDACKRKLRPDEAVIKQAGIFGVVTAAVTNDDALHWSQWKTRKFHNNLQRKSWWNNAVGVMVAASVVHSALIPEQSLMNNDQFVAFIILEAWLFGFFLFEAVSKTMAFRKYTSTLPIACGA